MSAEEVVKLLDSYWFERRFLSHNPMDAPTKAADQEVEEEAKYSGLPRTLHVRSLSDQLSSSRRSFSYGSLSISSVSLMSTPPKLQTILSDKQVLEFSKEEERVKKRESERKRRKLASAKSLSDLEFEELKGFMDLGFVFSEEEKDSRLVSIIPGLQRLGRKGSGDGEEEGEINETLVSRPYLSEAWDVLGRLKNWKIPAPGNEMDMKDQLRFWAHTVASTVR
ncbi:uncharacterized protein LOC132183192 [Corylus avellana]|uniref:uncharacterized protein LOC132183192 n=1 Tax=Corylus avellana TaxID=13451 RepID=UPI001E2005F9|nr:uncharacterized protein LOC132183192 [Corylus avellana]